MEFLNDLRMLGVDDAILKKAWRMWSGTPIYLPKYQDMTHIERNAIIRQEFNGRNQRELAVKHNLNYSWICKIVRRAECKRVWTC